MAPSEVAPIIKSANISPPGREVLSDWPRNDNSVLPKQNPESPFPKSNVTVNIIPINELPSALPHLVQFAAIRDPRLRIVRAIQLNVSVEESHVVVCWPETNEFGTGDTLSTALDDFESGLRDLYRRLFASDVKLGADLIKVRTELEQHIQPRS